MMRPDGSGVRQLTHLRIPRLLSGLTATAWSADGCATARRVRRPGHERGVDRRRRQRPRARPDRQIRRRDRRGPVGRRHDRARAARLLRRPAAPVGRDDRDDRLRRRQSDGARAPRQRAELGRLSGQPPTRKPLHRVAVENAPPRRGRGRNRPRRSARSAVLRSACGWARAATGPSAHRGASPPEATRDRGRRPDDARAAAAA